LFQLLKFYGWRIVKCVILTSK